MIFLGDIHSDYSKIPDTVETIIQVGDFGIGFRPYKPRKNVYFIRGNHDNPVVCQKTYGYLGDYGVKYLCDEKIGFVSGAYSIDKKVRTIGIDWWEDEELPRSKFYDIMDLFKKEKPNIIVSHDCPFVIDIKGIKGQSLTSQGLDMIFMHYQPKLWVFGHHHKSFRQEYNGCKFVGLNINEIWWIGKD